jgi:hypothetical protein
VRDLERDPGQGYFRLYDKRELEDIPWWLEEVRRSKYFDWSPYLSGTTISKKQQPEGASEQSPSVTVASLARADSRFFLKSEYGPLLSDWPAVAFSSRSVGVKIQDNFRPNSDFIVFTGTGGPETADPAHRSRLLSLVRIDTAEIQPTSELIPKHSWERVRGEYPGQWENCFEAVSGWNFVPFPLSRDTLPTTYPKIGLHRGDLLEIAKNDQAALLELRVTPLLLRSPKREDAEGEVPSTEPDLLAEARRIASLIFARVAISGETVQHTAPERTAPDDLVPNIHTLLQANPLVCYLCGGVMQIKPKNRLLQPSPDRVDSSIGDYGIENLRLVHLACNLGKNASSVTEFSEWLAIIRAI